MEGIIEKRTYHKRERMKKNTLMIVGAIATFLLLTNNGVLSALHYPPVIQISENSLSYTFFFDTPIMTKVQANNQTYTKIDMDDCFSYAQPGFPTLPVYRALLLLPKGQQVENIQVTYQERQQIQYDTLSKPILPEQEFVRVGMDENPSFIINDTIYSSSSPALEGIYKNGGVGYCRGYAILTVYMYPIQYIPGTGMITYFPEMKVTIQIQQCEEQTLTENLSFLRNNEADEDVIREMVTNPSILSTYETEVMNVLGEGMKTDQSDTFSGGLNEGDRLEGGYEGGICDSIDQYQYVIVTSESLKDTTGYPYNWSSLITHRKTFSDLNGTIITVQEIDACQDYWNCTSTFNDSSAHLREFCKDAYLDWKTEYVLLGGDWDSTESHQIVPYRLFTDRDETDTYKTMACDKYFSNLDGNWYYSPLDIWGGGSNSGVNDYYAELYVGRIAAYNASMVSNAVGKIIWYDLNASSDWLSQVSFLGGNLGWTATSKQYMEELRLGTDTYRIFTGFEEWNAAHPEIPIDTTEDIYHADVGNNFKTYLSNSIENDNASIINHLDHSDWNSPFGLTNWQYRYNIKPFFGYSQGCLAGRFHAGFAGSEQLMCRFPERNAFALVLNTGYGYASSTSSNGPSQYIQCYFYDYFFNNQSNNMNNWQLGKAQAYANEKTSAKIEISSHAWCYAWYSAHFFGDPAQILRLKNSNSDAITISNENPTNESTNVPINTTALMMRIQQSQGCFFNYTVQTTPNIGNSIQFNATNGTKICLITNLTYSTTYYWFVNVTDGNSWARKTYIFTTQASPGNLPLIISNCTPANASINLSISTDSLTVLIQDPDTDFFNWTITTLPNVGNRSGTSESNGTKTCNISGLTYSTTYVWFVKAYDGNNWTNSSFWFSTEDLDLTPPQISNILFNASNPIDIQPGVGWENITCIVTDNLNVDKVQVNITTPDNLTSNITMQGKIGTNSYYYNTSFSTYGNFSYYIWACDIHNNHVVSLTDHFLIPPNWDINNDGNCSILDLTLGSNKYGQTGSAGWIREDIDNNGKVEVYDFVLLSNHFADSWLE
jgi:hypothetical protein